MYGFFSNWFLNNSATIKNTINNVITKRKEVEIKTINPRQYPSQTSFLRVNAKITRDKAINKKIIVPIIAGAFSYPTPPILVVDAPTPIEAVRYPTLTKPGPSTPFLGGFFADVVELKVSA